MKRKLAWPARDSLFQTPTSQYQDPQKQEVKESECEGLQGVEGGEEKGKPVLTAQLWARYWQLKQQTDQLINGNKLKEKRECGNKVKVNKQIKKRGTKKERKKVRLYWGFDTKKRWETKGNM